MTPEQLKTRLQLLHEYSDNMRDDQLRQHLKKCERTRHWLIWHDHSSIASSGFMLFLVREVFDPAVHLTNQEQKEKQGGKGVDVQSVIEAPHLYMLGAAGAKDSDQLAFIPTNRQCLKELKFTEVQVPDKTERVELKEKMRFINGDNPAVEFEDGTQKGGHTCLNHIANILTELPLHMTDVDALLLFKEITTLALKKDKLRATDYRRAILKVTIALSKKNLLTEDKKDILILFCEMMGIYYENDGKAPDQCYAFIISHLDMVKPSRSCSPHQRN